MRTAEQEIATALERGDAVGVRYWTRIRNLVDEAPDLDAFPALRDQLEVLLRPEPAPITPRRRIPAQRPQQSKTTTPAEAAAELNRGSR